MCKYVTSFKVKRRGVDNSALIGYLSRRRQSLKRALQLRATSLYDWRHHQGYSMKVTEFCTRRSFLAWAMLVMGMPLVYMGIPLYTSNVCGVLAGGFAYIGFILWSIWLRLLD